MNIGAIYNSSKGDSWNVNAMHFVLRGGQHLVQVQRVGCDVEGVARVNEPHLRPLEIKLQLRLALIISIYLFNELLQLILIPKMDEIDNVLIVIVLVDLFINLFLMEGIIDTQV